MAGPIATDTPDYQRSVVSAQKLLATVAAGTQSVVVGLPPNTETLVVTMARNTVAYDARCTGVQSGLGYPGVLALNTLDNISSSTWFFDVSDVIDSEVDVSFVGEATSAWWVYADAGVHVVADASKATNQLGQQYVVPVPPSNLTLDHPPVELQYSAFEMTANGTVLAAPGAGQRHRLFSASMAIVGGSAAGACAVVLQDNSGTWLATCAGGGPQYGCGTTNLTWPLSGLPLTANAPITIGYWTGIGGTVLGALSYTTEEV